MWSEGSPSSPGSDEAAVRRVVGAFYQAFNAHDFDGARDLVTEDWVHVNPLGGWQRGRDAVLDELRAVHSSFLDGVSDEPEEMSVNFATSDVAVVLVPSVLSPFTLPDGRRFEDARPFRSFVVVRRDGAWRILLDQNTFRGR